MSLPLIWGWKNTDLQVSLFPHDRDKRDDTDLVSSEGHAISELDDDAQWAAPVPGTPVPNVNAHKGNTDVLSQGAGDITTTTMPYTGSEPFYTTANAGSLAYATAEAKRRRFSAP